MQIHVTEEAVMITDLSEEDRQFLEGLIRRAAGHSLVIPRKPEMQPALSEPEQLEALIAALRGSAQDTLSALRRRGFRVARDYGA